MQRHNKPWRIVFLISLLVLTIGISFYRIHQMQKETDRIAYQAEAMYQRNFGELSDSVTNMNEQLAQLLVTASQEQLLYGLSNLWREVYSAIRSLGTLPIAMHQLTETDLLLHDMREYSYYLMRKNVLQQKPLSTADWNQLESFYRRSEVVQQELQTLETAILTEDFRLTTLSLEDEQNMFAHTFQSIETKVDAFPEIEFEEGVRKIEPEPKPPQGNMVSEAEAIERANQFLFTLQPSSGTPQGDLVFRIDHTAIPLYCIGYPNDCYIEVSQIGGHILQYYQFRERTDATLTPESAKTQAYHILSQLQFTDMVCVEQQFDQTTAYFVFVPVQENVYLYPDMVKLQISLDDGTLLSFDQTSYQTRHHMRTIAKPEQTAAELLQNRNPNFHISSIHLALITDLYSTQEILTYELRGTILEEQFAIFINANTGQELRIVHF